MDDLGGTWDDLGALELKKGSLPADSMRGAWEKDTTRQSRELIDAGTGGSTTISNKSKYFATLSRL